MVAILVPVLARPGNVGRLVESIVSTTPEASVLFLTTPGDDDEKRAIDLVGCQWLDVEWVGVGEYARKINAGVKATTDPLLFVGADDLRFHDGWLEAASALMAESVDVVGTNDLGNPSVIAGDHATHCLVRRDYVEHGTVDQPGRLLHEGYAHNFVDNEFVETAKVRHAWAFASDSIVEHLHPSWSKAERDNTYNLGRRRFERDRRLFHRRQPLWTSPSS